MSLMDDLKNELAQRIQHDMEPLGKWSPALWTKITFGDYYGKTPELLTVIHRAVGETVDNVLIDRDLQMTVDSWNGLKSAINAADTPETALPDMEEAALVTESREEGLSELLKKAAARPTKKRKVKSASKKGASKKGAKKRRK